MARPMAISSECDAMVTINLRKGHTEVCKGICPHVLELVYESHDDQVSESEEGNAGGVSSGICGLMKCDANVMLDRNDMVTMMPRL